MLATFFDTFIIICFFVCILACSKFSFDRYQRNKRNHVLEIRTHKFQISYVSTAPATSDQHMPLVTIAKIQADVSRNSYFKCTGRRRSECRRKHPNGHATPVAGNSWFGTNLVFRFWNLYSGAGFKYHAGFLKLFFDCWVMIFRVLLFYIFLEFENTSVYC